MTTEMVEVEEGPPSGGVPKSEEHGKIVEQNNVVETNEEI